MMIVNVNDIKILHPPCTKNWKLNEKYIPQILSDLQSKETTASPLIDFSVIHALVQDLLDGKPIKFKFFIIPDWPCAEWYKILHDKIIAEAVRLPEEEDLFIQPGKNLNCSMGKFPWSHWIFELREDRR